MEDKTVQQSGALALICPTCGARYTLPKYVEGQRYGCKRCSASLMFGKFALQQELGRGGFGVVYKAFQADLQRVVALKFLHSDGEESTERFMREARIAANLSHPNIIAIYEVGQHEGKPYITMQFIDGITTNKADLSIREAVFVMRDAAIAVDYAHARDIIHRDIKPHNIMITQERSGTSAGETTRRTFVMDFGLARSANKGGTLTTEGQVMGTPAFMAPEQAEGKPCDLRSDVYSLGATLFSLVTKRPPFEAPTPLQVLMQVTQEDPPAPSSINPDIDKGLEAIILKAMAKDPTQRYPTASRFAQDLTSWLAGGVTDAAATVHLSSTPGALAATRRKKKPKSGAMIAVGAALILAGGGGLAWKILGKPGPEAPSKGIVDTRKIDPGTVPPPPPPPPSTTMLLEVVTDPADAVVRIDTGNREYRSPVSLNDSQISPGVHEVVITKPGYQMVKESVTVTPGGTVTRVSRKLEREARKVAFVLESTPAGARIMLNETDTGATTPHTIYQDDVGGIAAKIVLELDGYFPATRHIDPNGATQRVALAAKTGTFVLGGASPGAVVHLFALPASVKNARAVTGLWSENSDALAQAVGSLDDADVPLVVDRLKVLKTKADPRIRDRVAALSARAASATPVAPEKSVTADGRGNARLENAWVLNRYRIFATSPQTLDYLSAELTPRLREEDNVLAEMIQLSSVGAKAVRPPVGKLRVLLADQSEAGVLVPGTASTVKVLAGKVVLQFVPPGNDPLLRDFSIPLTVQEPYELAGNLYQYSGEAHKNAGNVLLAVKAYTRVLEEKPFPPSEQAERSKLPDLIRGLYRSWIDDAVARGRTGGGDPAAALEEAKGKRPDEAIPLLVDVYAAKDAPPVVRGGAAAALASLLGKQRQAYEAVEWAERSVREKVDPGAETTTLISGLARQFPGLPERWDAVALAIEDARKSVQAKVDLPPPPPPPPAALRLGTLQVTKFGTFLKLDPEMTVAKGDVLEFFRDGASIGEILVISTHGPEATYPNGYAEVRKGTGGSPAKNDEVRRKK